MTAVATSVGSLFERLCDDAAVFPPGSLPLEQAVVAHAEHLTSPHSRAVGPFVVAASHLPRLARRVAGLPGGSFDVAVTVSKPGAAGVALAVADSVPALAVRAIEVAVPADVPVEAVVPTLRAALAGRPGIEVFVEVPRDRRRGDLVAALSHTAYLAKLRTGGVRADLHPDERELAAAVVALVRAGVPFKATAGLHHAIRNTDPGTGFEQHGFLNVITAVDAALTGADAALVEGLLAERDAHVVADRVRALGGWSPRVREQFRSFGTCSITEPVEELAALGLLDTSRHTTDTAPGDRL